MGLVSIPERSQEVSRKRTQALQPPSESLRPLSRASERPDAEPGAPDLRAKNRQHLGKMFETWRKMAGCNTRK